MDCHYLPKVVSERKAKVEEEDYEMETKCIHNSYP